MSVSRHRLVFDRPLAQPVDLATASATLRGAYRTALALRTCVREGECARRADAEKTEVRCADRVGCPNGVLYEAAGRFRAREHPPALTVWVNAVTPEYLEVEVVLWGARAVNLKPEAMRALAVAGKPGLLLDGAWSAFSVEDHGAFVGTLGDRAQPSVGGYPDRALLELLTPWDVGRASAGQAAPEFNLGAVLGHLAHDLMQWELEETAPELPKREADERSDRLREHVRDLMRNVEIDGGAVAWVDLPARRSRGNGRIFQLGGYQGYCTLRGDLSAVWPWFRALELRGAGQHRLFGLGRARLWLEPPGH